MRGNRRGLNQYGSNNLNGSSRGRGASHRGMGRRDIRPETIYNLTQGLKPTPLSTLPLPSIGTDSSMVNAQLTNLEHVASYNWINDSKSTIIVPG